MNQNTLFIARMSLFIALTLVIQIPGLPQAVTGPLINAVLFIITVVQGPLAGVALGLITPLVALIRGQLPVILAPMIPFIMLGNASLVLIYWILTSKFNLSLRRSWLLLIPVALSAAAKTVLLWLSVRYAIPLFIGQRLPTPVEVMMAFPQFITAMAGGILFLVFLRLTGKWILLSTVQPLPRDASRGSSD